MLVYPPTGVALPTDLRPGGRAADWRPSRPRYVVLDVDGTLLGLTGVATPAVEAAVAACRADGLPVGLATGRMPSACRALAGQLGLSGPHVVHNGAEVRADGASVRRWPLDRAQVDALLAVCAAHDLYAEVYVGDGYWVTDRRDRARPHWDLLSEGPSGLIADCDLDAVLKATLLLFDDDDLDGVLDDLAAADLACGPAHAPAIPQVTFVNVTAPGADKGAALAAAAAHVGCGLDEVVAVGDGLNDLSMLAVAGTAIAMGQASSEVIAAAHLVVPEVDADGVDHALRAALGWRA
jgi:Cof subfamily protein (haloacid dehalogenase superfamily)